MAPNTGKKPYFGLTGGWLTFWLTLACATDMTLFGYDQGVFSGVVINQNFLKLHDLVGPSRTKVLSTVAAIYDVGCFLGAIAACIFGERLGRKKTVLIGTTIMTIGAILTASSYSLAQIFVGRVVLGIGNGINTSTAPIWQTEASQPKWRGKLVILEMGMNIVGFCMVNWINYGLSFKGGAFSWRFPLAFQFIFIIILYLTVPWLPESPRWLIGQDRHDEAIAVLAALAGKPENDPYVTAQFEDVRSSVQYEREHSLKWKDIIKSDAGSTKPFRRMLLGAGTQLMQQFGGINVISYYMPTVLIAYVGVSSNTARLLSACNATSYLVASWCAIPLVDKLGRRGLMLLSTFGQFLCFLVITILLSLNERNASKGAIAFFFLYYISFAIGMLGVPWLYPTEINSLPMRTKGAAVATMTNWITNFVIVEITPIGIQNLGWKFWIVWTIFNAVFLPIIYFCYPETSNRSLEDLDDYYRTNPPVVVTGDKDAISSARPAKYLERESQLVHRRLGTVVDYDEEKTDVRVTHVE